MAISDGVALQTADLHRLPSATSRTQTSSHSVSVGQTRAHMPPRIFWSKIVLAEPIGLPVDIWRMNSGMSIEVGHAFMHGAS